MYRNEDINNVGVGWHPIIRQVDAAMRLIDPDYEVVQIKEKFGGLRYYFAPSEALREAEDFATRMWAMNALTSQAEAESFHVCEDCGKAGTKVVIGSWHRTLCRPCTAKAWAVWAERETKWKKHHVKEEETP